MLSESDPPFYVINLIYSMSIKSSEGIKAQCTCPVNVSAVCSEKTSLRRMFTLCGLTWLFICSYCRITSGFESCIPCFCQQTALRCEGEHVTYFPNQLGDATKSNLEYIFIVGTLISYLPELQSADEYGKLTNFVESTNFILNCQNVSHWYMTLLQTTFDTQCNLPVRTTSTRPVTTSTSTSSTTYLATSITSITFDNNSSRPAGTDSTDITKLETKTEISTTSSHWTSDVTLTTETATGTDHDMATTRNLAVWLAPLCIGLLLFNGAFVFCLCKFVKSKSRVSRENARNSFSQIYRDPNEGAFELNEIHNGENDSYC